jgi:hypothetical protein
MMAVQAPQSEKKPVASGLMPSAHKCYCRARVSLSQCATQGEGVSAWHILRQDVTSAVGEIRPELEQFWRAMDVPRPRERHHSAQRSFLRTRASGTTASAAPLLASLPTSLNQRIVRDQPLSERRFRGKVWLRAAGGVCCIESVCSLNHAHVVLYGSDDNWETELVKVPIDHLMVDVQVNEPCSFQIKVKSDTEFGLDTRVVLTVSSPVKRDNWLSALSDCGANIQGWDASHSESTCCPSSTFASRNFVPGVTWLS